MIRFACPGCAAEYSVGDERAGKVTRCPKCQTKFLIPEPAAADPAAPAEPPPPEAPPPLPPPPPPPPAVSDEPVEIAPCPKCGTRLSVMPADLGLDVECPGCQTVFKAVKPGAAPRVNTPAPPPPAPPAPPPAPPRRSALEATDDSGTPVRRRRRDEDDDGDDRPSRRGPRPRDEDEEDERPSRRGRRRDEDEDEEERPSRRGRRDEDDDEDDRPRRRRRRPSRRGGEEGNPAVRMASGVFALLIGGLQSLIGILFATAGTWLMAQISGVPVDEMAGGDPRMAQNAQAAKGLAGAITGAFIFCGICTIVLALPYIFAGIGVIGRKGYGKVMTIITAVLSVLGALSSIYMVIQALSAGFTTAILFYLVWLILYAGHAVTGFMATMGAGANDFD